MNLHRNAALSMKGRRELCRRVVEGERTLSEAAAAAEVSVRCARKWVARYREEGELGPIGSFLGASLDPASHERSTGPGDRGA
jgi:transposase